MATTMSLKERIEQHKKEAESRKGGGFLKWVDDGDSYLIKVMLPFEGYDKLVENKKQNTSQMKRHFRAFVLGGVNFGTGKQLLIPQQNYTVEQVRTLRFEDVKTITASPSLRDGIWNATKNKHSVLLIVRNGIRDSTSTTYTVYPVANMSEEQLSAIAPNLTKQDIAKLDSEVDYEEVISDVELEALLSMGKKDNGGSN